MTDLISREEAAKVAEAERYDNRLEKDMMRRETERPHFKLSDLLTGEPTAARADERAKTMTTAEIDALITRVEQYRKLFDDFARDNGGRRLGDMELTMECLSALLHSLKDKS